MQGEGTPLSGSALHRDLPAMGLGDVFYDGKTQPGAAQFPAPGFVHTIKSFEQTRQMRFGDADSRISKADENF